MPKTKVKPKKSAKKETKMLKNQIAIVLDSSGSMQSCHRATVDALNNQIQTIRQNSDGMETRVSLVTFASFPDAPKFFDAPVSVLKEITYEDYRPNGGTAMYDAVGDTIERLKALKEPEDTSFLIIIISDGEENSSRRFSQNDIAERVQELQDSKRWTFTYLGANQDLADISKHLNIHIGNTAWFDSSHDGMVLAKHVTGAATGAYLCARSVGATAVNNFYDNSAVNKAKKDGTDDTLKMPTPQTSDTIEVIQTGDTLDTTKLTK